MEITETITYERQAYGAPFTIKDTPKGMWVENEHGSICYFSDYQRKYANLFCAAPRMLDALIEAREVFVRISMTCPIGIRKLIDEMIRNETTPVTRTVPPPASEWRTGERRGGKKNANM